MTAKETQIALGTDFAGRLDAFNPVELFLASIAACMIKGVERIAPILKFLFDGVNAKLHGVRQDVPPEIVSITYKLVIDAQESDQELELLHANVKKFGTIFYTVAKATQLSGTMTIFCGCSCQIQQGQ